MRSTTVVMVDREDGTLHLPAIGRGNLVTECGLVLHHSTIGPRAAVEGMGLRRCPECWSDAE
jgi:hypothetical protein